MTVTEIGWAATRRNERLEQRIVALQAGSDSAKLGVGGYKGRRTYGENSGEDGAVRADTGAV